MPDTFVVVFSQRPFNRGQYRCDANVFSNCLSAIEDGERKVMGPKIVQVWMDQSHSRINRMYDQEKVTLFVFEKCFNVAQADIHFNFLTLQSYQIFQRRVALRIFDGSFL